jgi:hypothetical protein
MNRDSSDLQFKSKEKVIKKKSLRTPSNFFKNLNKKSDLLKSNEVNKSQEALLLFRNLKNRKMKYNQFDPLGTLKTNLSNSKELLFLSEAPKLDLSDTESESDNSFERKIQLTTQNQKHHQVTSDLLSSKMEEEEEESQNDSFDLLNISKKRLSGSSGYSFSRENNANIFSEDDEFTEKKLDIYAGKNVRIIKLI